MSFDYQYLIFYDTLNAYCQNQQLHLKHENSLQLSIIQDNRTEQYRMVIDALHSTCINELFMDYLATLFCYHDALNGCKDELAQTGIIYDYHMIPRSANNEQIKIQKQSHAIFKPLTKIIDNSFCHHFVSRANLDAIHNFFDNKNEFHTFKLFQKFLFFDGYENNLNDIFDVNQLESIREKINLEKVIKIKEQIHQTKDYKI